MIETLRKRIIEANTSYRLGKPMMSDSKFDQLIDELSLLSPNDELLTKVGHTIMDESRKSRLPIEMASMTKTKSLEDINNWCRLKGISTKETVIITPKFDGLSLCVDETTKECWTRGDGEFGQKSNEHYKLIQNHLKSKKLLFKYTYGEVMMPKKVFLDKYSADFANPRNLVSGLLNSKDAAESLKDCQYIKYGADGWKDFQTKQDIINELNKGQSQKVSYHLCQISDLTEQMLIDLFHRWCVDFEIDGLIIEINDLNRQEELGRETSSNNPVWARAFKHPSFEQCAQTEVVGISWNISKQGYLKPTLHVNPVKLDGVTVSNVTGNNARFVKDMGLGIGSVVLIKRSGMVIPLIVDVLKSVEFVMPNIPDIDWNDNGVELVTLKETDEQNLKRTISFFEILETKGVSEGVIKQFWEAKLSDGSDLIDKTNFHSALKSILSLTEDDMTKIYRFGKRKATIIYTAIQSSIKNVSLSKLQHASGIFKGLGSKKLLLLEEFNKKPPLDKVMAIEGFAQISAQSYVDNYDNFFDFIKDLPIGIKKEVAKVATGGNLIGQSFVFTGVRLPQYEKIIEENGGKVSSTVSKNTTYLIMKSKGSGSTKEKKAIELGIKVLEVSDLEKILKIQ